MTRTLSNRARAGRAVVVIGSVLITLLSAGCGVGRQAATPPPVAVSPAPVADGPSASETPPPTPAESPACRSADLTLAVVGNEGAAGHIYRRLQFTNHGDHTCVMHGFPGVSYVAGDDGHQVGPAATRDGEIGPQVTLIPGDNAVADVGFTNVELFDPAVCQPAAVNGLRVYPPNERAAMYVPLPGTGCASNTPSPQLQVRTTTAS